MGQLSVIRAAAVQLCSASDIERNLRVCERWIRHAAAARAQIVALPENFAYIGSLAKKAELAEDLTRPTEQPVIGRLGRLAEELGIWLLLGGVPTRTTDPARFLNSAVLLDPTGAVAATYHKIHLFDVDIPGGAVFQESACVDAGHEVVSTPALETRLGLSICYDLRFPALYQELTSQGSEIVFVPAAFTLHTGKDHWLALLRARAIENQVYVVAPAQYGHHTEKRCSYGHSCVVDPWGTVLAQQGGDQDGVVISELDLDYLRRVRRELPALKHRRL